MAHSLRAESTMVVKPIDCDDCAVCGVCKDVALQKAVQMESRLLSVGLDANSVGLCGNRMEFSS